MKLSQEAVNEYYQIHSYGNDHVVISLKQQNRFETLNNNFVLTSSQIVTNWPVSEIVDISSDQLADLKRLEPEVILFATGSSFCIEFQRITNYFIQSQIGVEFMDLGAACRTFNLLVSEQRKVLLAVSFEAL